MTIDKYRRLHIWKCAAQNSNPEIVPSKQLGGFQWNLAGMYHLSTQLELSRRFSVFDPWAEIWGPRRAPLGGENREKFFFDFFSFFVLYAYLEVPSLAKTGFKSRKLNFSLDSASKLTWCQILLTESSPLSASSNFVTNVQERSQRGPREPKPGPGRP